MILIHRVSEFNFGGDSPKAFKVLTVPTTFQYWIPDYRKAYQNGAVMSGYLRKALMHMY